MKVVVVLPISGKEFFVGEELDWDLPAYQSGIDGSLVVNEVTRTPKKLPDGRDFESVTKKILGAFAPGQWSHVRYVDENKVSFSGETFSVVTKSSIPLSVTVPVQAEDSEK